MVKNAPSNARDTRDVGSTLGSGRSPGVGYGNPLQYSPLENSMDRRAWWAIQSVHGSTKGQTRLSVHTHTHTHTHAHTHRLHSPSFIQLTPPPQSPSIPTSCWIQLPSTGLHLGYSFVTLSHHSSLSVCLSPTSNSKLRGNTITPQLSE